MVSKICNYSHYLWRKIEGCRWFYQQISRKQPHQPLDTLLVPAEPVDACSCYGNIFLGFVGKKREACGLSECAQFYS
jgi:hypothetical protein